MERQCPELLFLALGGVVASGYVDEYRCELEAGHEDNWHKDVDYMWRTC